MSEIGSRHVAFIRNVIGRAGLHVTFSMEPTSCQVRDSLRAEEAT